jgi:hypothetical protein
MTPASFDFTPLVPAGLPAPAALAAAFGDPRGGFSFG